MYLYLYIDELGKTVREDGKEFKMFRKGKDLR